MPYTIRKGVLYHDGRAQIALGQSYYPSYHPQKVPVPPTGDRLGRDGQGPAGHAGSGLQRGAHGGPGGCHL